MFTLAIGLAGPVVTGSNVAYAGPSRGALQTDSNQSSLGLAAAVPSAASSKLSICSNSWGAISSPTPPNGAGPFPVGLAAVSASDIWAVGTATSSSGGTTLIEHWDGLTWSIASSPNPTGDTVSGLHAVAAISSTDVWAVGESGPDTASSSTLIEHWDGASWTIVPSPNLAGAVHSYLRGIAAISASDIWAVGIWRGGPTIHGGPLSLHWDGTAWNQVDVPETAGALGSLYAVTAVNASDLWAVGWVANANQALVERWNGSSWSEVTAPPAALFGVSAISATDIWAVGGATTNQAVIEKWNGSTWSVAPFPLPAGSLNSTFYGVAFSSVSNGLAVGYYVSGTADATLVERWNGTTWTIVPSQNPGDSHFLAAVTMLHDGQSWAFGNVQFGGSSNGYTLVESNCPPPAWPAALAGGGSPSMLYHAGVSGAGVNTLTGEFSVGLPALALPGRGVPLAFTVTYDSSAVGKTGVFGEGWTSDYSMVLTIDPAGTVFITEESGSTVRFQPSASGYQPDNYVRGTLTHLSDGTFVYSRNKRESLHFSAAGRLLTKADRNGYVTTFAYNLAGQLLSVTEPAGRSLTFAYASNGQVASVTDPGGRSVAFSYDTKGQLVSATDVANGIWTFAYDTAGRLLRLTDPGSRRLTNVYDSLGRVVRQIDPMSRRTTFAYATGSAISQTTVVTDPLGHKSRYLFQDRELAAVTRGFGTAAQSTTMYTYDPATLGVATVTDPNGHVSSSTYDLRGNLLTHTDPRGAVTSYTYDAMNDELTVTDAAGITTTLSYDGGGNLTSSSTPLAGTSQVATTTYGYDPSHPGDVISMTDADSHTWTFTYDSQGNRQSMSDPLGNTASYSYDALGRVTLLISPNGHKSLFTYNAFGDPLTTTDPLGAITTYSYDAVRNLTSVTDANGNRTSYAYDLDNERLKATRLASNGSVLQVISTNYDLAGNVTTQLDGLGGATSYSYDALNRRVSLTDGLSRTTTYVYDGVDNLIRVINPSGGVTTKAYDPANQLISISHSDGTTPNATLSYDANGQRTSMRDGTGLSTYTYDSLHRLTQTVDGTGAVTSYAYDLDGNLTSLTYPDGSQVTQTYDGANRLISIRDWLGEVTNFTYDPDGNLIAEAYPNGVMSQRSYDAADRLTSIRDVNGATTLLQLTYARDSIGQVMQEGTTSFSYDAINRVTASSLATYAYDAADRMTNAAEGSVTGTFSYDAANELTSLATSTVSSTFSYDQQGNRTARSNSPGIAASFSYDQENRLIDYSSGSINAHYVYNGDGIRTSKIVNGSSQAFSWEFASPLPLLLAGGATRYVYGPDGFPIEQVDGTNRVLFYHQDQLGSTRLLTDSTGAIADSYTYDPYGNIPNRTGIDANPFTFASEFTDGETGFVYMRARYYDPSTAQFISRDPLLFKTRQAYAYVSDNPVNHLDASGLQGDSVGSSAAAGVMAGGDPATLENTSSDALLLSTCGYASGSDSASQINSNEWQPTAPALAAGIADNASSASTGSNASYPWVVERLNGTVELRHGDSGQWLAVFSSKDLQAGDWVRVHEASLAAVELPNGQRATIYERQILKVDNLAPDPPFWSQFWGNLKAEAKHLFNEKSVPVEVGTPSAFVGTKG